MPFFDLSVAAFGFAAAAVFAGSNFGGSPPNSLVSLGESAGVAESGMTAVVVLCAQATRLRAATIRRWRQSWTGPAIGSRGVTVADDKFRGIIPEPGSCRR